MDRLPHLFGQDVSGDSVWLEADGDPITVNSEPNIVGRMTSPTSQQKAHFFIELPASTIVTACHIRVWNDVEGTEIGRVALPTYDFDVWLDFPWASANVYHLTRPPIRRLTTRATNWSHTYGRWFQTSITYRLARRVPEPSEEDYTRYLASLKPV